MGSATRIRGRHARIGADGPWKTVPHGSADGRETTELSLPGRVVRRFLPADGMSHSRALAYETKLIVFSGLTGLFGIASLIDLARALSRPCAGSRRASRPSARRSTR